MATTLAIKEGGGSSSETVTTLWTNPSPTATFNSTTVTLSDDIRNYKKFRIVHKITTGAAMLINLTFDTFVDEDTQLVHTSAVPVGICIFAGGATRCRYGYVTTSDYTKFVFSSCLNLGTTGTDNTAAIPVYIYGIN